MKNLIKKILKEDFNPEDFEWVREIDPLNTFKETLSLKPRAQVMARLYAFHAIRPFAALSADSSVVVVHKLLPTTFTFVSVEIF